VRHNIVEGAYGAGIFANDREAGFHNEISSNFLKGNGTHQATGAITLEDAAETTVHDNTISAQGAGGFALRLEGGPHTRAVQITNNTFFGSPANMLYVAQTARNTFVADRNSYYAKQPRFRCASQEYSFAEWQHATRQDAHSAVADPALLQSPEISSDRQSN
jgi:Periplasmic copper-binding protein (NosD)